MIAASARMAAAPPRSPFRPGPVILVVYSELAPHRRSLSTTHYGPPNLVALMRDVVETELRSNWNDVRAHATKDGNVAIKERAHPHYLLASIGVISDHPPLSVIEVQDAINALRFNQPPAVAKKGRGR